VWRALPDQGPLLRLLLLRRHGAGKGIQWGGGAPQALAVAICQARSDARGGEYYRKKMMAEGKSPKEALRCLKKRRISDAVFRSLMADLQAPSRSAA
jgi:hypothetical protein